MVVVGCLIISLVVLYPVPALNTVPSDPGTAHDHAQVEWHSAYATDGQVAAGTIT